MYVTADTLITAGAVLGAIVSFVTLFWKLFKWIDHQKEQDQKIAEIEAQHNKDISELKKHFEEEIEKLRGKHETDTHAIQEEQTLVIYGLLACLKGLNEQGCNGAVTEAIGKIEKHINQKAHER